MELYLAFESLGFAKLGFGMTENDAAQQAQKQKTANAPKYTGEVASKYGGQKAISSDQFFGKGSYDVNAQQEAHSKLQAFNSSTAISSSSYFGEDEESQQGPNRGGNNSNNNEFASFASTTNDDLAVLKDALETGANKLSGYLRDYLRNWSILFFYYFFIQTPQINVPKYTDFLYNCLLIERRQRRVRQR